MPAKKEDIIIISPKEIFVGKKDAMVTLMEFGEYENEEVAKANEVVKQLMLDFKDKIRFQFRHFPLTLIHQRSLKASESAIAAGQEGKFWEMHNLLFQNRRNLGTTSLKIYSKEAGVKNKNFLEELVNGMYGWEVQDDIKEGHQRGIKDIPAFFINEEPYTGKLTLPALSAAIELAIVKSIKNKGAKIKVQNFAPLKKALPNKRVTKSKAPKQEPEPITTVEKKTVSNKTVTKAKVLKQLLEKDKNLIHKAKKIKK